MSAEAIARLRRVAMQVGLQAVGRDGMNVTTADLRALLDAHAKLETAHTEALDALERSHSTLLVLTKLGVYLGERDPRGDPGGDLLRRNSAVLAKAGRR